MAPAGSAGTVAVRARGLVPPRTARETLGFPIPQRLERQVHEALLFIVFPALVQFLLTQLEAEIAGLGSRGWGRTEQVASAAAALTVPAWTPLCGRLVPAWGPRCPAPE